MILLIFLIIALPLLIYFTINSFLDYTFDKKCSSGKNIVIYDAKNFSILRNYVKNYKIIVPNIFDSSGFGKVKRNCYFERNDEYPEYISFH